jgi:hypothetical protein
METIVYQHVLRVFGTTQNPPEELMFCTSAEAKELGWKIVGTWSPASNPRMMVWDLQWIGKQETVVVPEEVVRQINEHRRNQEGLTSSV